MALNKAVFIDKDGTLIENVPQNVDAGQLRFAPLALDAARRFVDSGYKLIVVTNQSGLAELQRRERGRGHQHVAEVVQADGEDALGVTPGGHGLPSVSVG